MSGDPIAYLEQALAILHHDEGRLELIENYLHGHHRPPYMPDGASSEYHLLATRSVTNWCPLLVATPAQALYVDNFRRSGEQSIDPQASPEWKHWQESRMDARQGVIYTEALAYGHSFVLTEKNAKGRVISRGLSPKRTVALYEDPAFDLDPDAAVYIKRWPTVVSEKPVRGLAYVWDDVMRYDVEFSLGELKPEIVDQTVHGSKSCPVTRFVTYSDLEGRAWGVIEPIIPLQDRINQTIFDLLMSQTYNSFEVRYVTGMAPPYVQEQKSDGSWGPKLDPEGNPIPDKVLFNASRLWMAEDPGAKFGNLPGGDLGGVIASAELAIKHLSALSQTPPHFLLGQIANVSADALEAAETALSRKVENFRNSYGESWERVFRIALEMLGESGSDDFLGEVIWRDLGASSLAQSADALGKFADNLEIPKRGLWARVPGVTRQELSEWRKLREEDDKEQQLINRSMPKATDPKSFGTQADGLSDEQAAA